LAIGRLIDVKDMPVRLLWKIARNIASFPLCHSTDGAVMSEADERQGGGLLREELHE
jgi:hypothetical protein